MDAPEPDRSRPVWLKSSYSNNGGNCIEVADVPATATSPALRLIRDSKEPRRPHPGAHPRSVAGVYRPGESRRFRPGLTHALGITPGACLPATPSPPPGALAALFPR
jgi:Domain of unknown function (DUF397)